jgi:hypothetical protein
MLTLRSTGLASPAYANWLDYVIVEAGRTVGRVAVRAVVSLRFLESLGLFVVSMGRQQTVYCAEFSNFL